MATAWTEMASRVAPLANAFEPTSAVCEAGGAATKVPDLISATSACVTSDGSMSYSSASRSQRSL